MAAEPVSEERYNMVQYIEKLVIIMAAALPLYLAFRFMQVKKRACGCGRTLAREIALGCFILFHTGLLVLALEGEYGSPAQMAERAVERIKTGTGINLVPFRTIAAFFQHFIMDVFLVNIVGNIIMFMPWGFGIVMLWEKNRNLSSIAGYSLLLPLFIETSQLFIGRSVDVDDLILNFTGSCIGAGIYFLMKKVAKLFQK